MSVLCERVMTCHGSILIDECKMTHRRKPNGDHKVKRNSAPKDILKKV